MFLLATVEINDLYPLPWGLPLEKGQLIEGIGIMVNVLGQQFAEMPKSITLYLVDDKTIALANHIYMQCSGPTNILSFPGQEDYSGVLLLSKDTYNRECRLYGQPRKEHLLRLLAHGLSHVAGLDHGEMMDRITGQLELVANQSLLATCSL